jgi:hypothetical protein
MIIQELIVVPTSRIWNYLLLHVSDGTECNAVKLANTRRGYPVTFYGKPGDVGGPAD